MQIKPKASKLGKWNDPTQRTSLDLASHFSLPLLILKAREPLQFSHAQTCPSFLPFTQNRIRFIIHHLLRSHWDNSIPRHPCECWYTLSLSSLSHAPSSSAATWFDGLPIIEMNGINNNNASSLALLIFLFSLLYLTLLPPIQCADGESTNPTVLPIVTQNIYERMTNVTTVLAKDIKQHLSFCIKDVCVMSPIIFSPTLFPHLSHTYWPYHSHLSGIMIGMGHSILPENWISWPLVLNRLKVCGLSFFFKL